MPWWALILGLALTACSPGSRAPAVAMDSSAPSADSGAPDAAPGRDADPASDVARGPCTPLPGQSADAGECIVEAKGEVTDLSGEPLPNLVVTFCGFECFGTRTDTSGRYVVPIGTYVDTEEYAIHADGRPDHAVDYVRMHAAEPRVISATMRLPTLPPSTISLPADGAPASSVTVGDLTLSVAAGTTFSLDVEDYGKPKGRLLRVAAVALASAPSFAAAARAAAVYALAPSGATSSKKMGVTLENHAKLPASAAVDLMILGDYFSPLPDIGRLYVVAAAHVSADGATIATDPGEGISKITWLAVRLKGT